MEKQSDLTIGLAGNPNVGKTTLFNALTGSRHHVGNWPGVTVERREGSVNINNQKVDLVDLPGVYGLSGQSESDALTVDYVLDEKSDVIIQIVDAQNLARNLFLTVQLLELGSPLILAVNFLEAAKADGICVSLKTLADLLDVPVIEVDARSRTSSREMMKKAVALVEQSRHRFKLNYGLEFDSAWDKIRKTLERNNHLLPRRSKWFALKLLEGDPRITERLTRDGVLDRTVQKQVQVVIRHLQQAHDQDINTILADVRFGFINRLERQAVCRNKMAEKRLTTVIDDLVTHRFFGLPIFLLVIWAVFQATFRLSEPLVNWIARFFELASDFLADLLVGLGTEGWLISLVTEGVIGGVGGVLMFVPIIGMLFLMLALLEDTGYMARITFVMDRFMRKIGLHGQAFIPLILGFGCNVPGIMATRTLESKKDRLLTILINPFMSCGARLPVYTLFAGIFFVEHQGLVVFSLYALGIVIAVIVAFFFRQFLFRQPSSPFIIELPPYRCPTAKGIAIHVWEKIWLFIKKAGTVILIFSVIVWFLASMPVGVQYSSEQSWAGSIGKAASFIFEPLGFDNWKVSVALIFGLVAKEVIVGTFGTLYGINGVTEHVGASFHNALQADFTPLSAFAFLVFVLLYAPCVAVLVVIKKETGSWKWPLFVIGYTIGVAWLVSFFVYQGGQLLGFT